MQSPLLTLPSKTIVSAFLFMHPLVAPEQTDLSILADSDGGMTEVAPEVSVSPLWEKALESYHEELAADDDIRTILETGSLEDLSVDDQILQPFGPHGRKALDSMIRLKPAFKLLNDFSAVLAVSFGAGTAATALVWGSIRMILTV